VALAPPPVLVHDAAMLRRGIVVLGLFVGGLASANPKPQKVSLPVVKLLDAGSGPKRALRIKPVVGAKQTLVMAMKMTMEMDSGATMHVPRTTLPVLELTMAAKVLDVNKAGEARYEFSVADINVVPGGSNPSVVEAVRKSVASLKGFSGHATVNARNFTIAGDLDVPDTIDANLHQMLDSMVQSMGQLSAPFPEEPIGKGGRWQTRTQLAVNGITVQQTTEYALTGLDGDKLVAKVQVVQKADPQPFTGSNVPPGLKMSVVSWSGNGGGELQLDLAKQFLAGAASLALASNTKMAMDANGQHQDMTMALDVAIDVKSTPE
jgi:hypothetical protein